MQGSFIVNSQAQQWHFPAEERLLLTLRRYGYTEVKNGCQEGECGACLILLNDELVNSCQVLTASAIGQRITTVKGIGDLHDPHIIQQAFVKAGAVQCGFCTPGMVMASYALLRDNPDPSTAEIKAGLDGNLCRCTGYVKIIEAVQLAADYLREKSGQQVSES